MNKRLGRDTAQQILRLADKIVGEDISIADCNGKILAGKNFEDKILVQNLIKRIEGNNDVEDCMRTKYCEMTIDEEQFVVKAIVQFQAVVGYLIIYNNAKLDENVGNLLDATITLVLDSMYSISTENIDGEFEEFLYDLVFKRKEEHDFSFYENAKIYGIDLTQTRVALILQVSKNERIDKTMVKKYLRKGEYILNYKTNDAVVIGTIQSGIVERIRRVFEFRNNSFRIFVGKKEADINESFRSAVFAQEICEYCAIEKDVANIEELTFESFVYSARNQEETKEIKRIFTEKDRANELCDTLQMFFDCDGNNILVCEKLFIHRNTLNYRLKKIEAITGKNPKKYKDLFILYCASML